MRRDMYPFGSVGGGGGGGGWRGAGRRRRDQQPKIEQVELDNDIYHKFQQIVNALTPQTFQALAEQALELQIDTEEKLKRVIDIIFAKALEEPNLGIVYANLCKVLSPIKVEWMQDGKTKKTTFRRVLLTKCQQEFEKDIKDDEEKESMLAAIEEAETDEQKKQLTEKMEEAEAKARRRSLGNIRFTGELFKLKMLSETIMHECIMRLLKSSSDEESIECFAILITTTGKDLDRSEAKPRIDQYFTRIQDIIQKGKISARIKFMLEDVKELRQNSWVQPTPQVKTKHKTMENVYKQKSFTYSGKEDHLLWEEYGIELHFPSASAVDIECIVSVLSIDDDNYIFPEGSELVSAVYDIRTNEPLPKPVTVRLQHCVPLDSKKDVLAMSFAIADTEQGPPYKFHPLNGGQFKCGSCSAEIQLAHFSMPTVIRWCQWLLGRPIPFSAGVYYPQKNFASFVVTKNLQAHINAVRNHFKSAILQCEFLLKTDRRSAAIQLEIPAHSTWEVTPHIIPPQIHMAFVLDYQPGRTIPQITMEIICKQTQEGQPKDKYVTVKLRGVHEQTSLRLKCSHHSTVTDPQKTTTCTAREPSSHSQPPTPAAGSCPDLIKLIRFRGRERKHNIPQEVGTHYQQFGILLLNDPNGSQVKNIVHKCRGDPEDITQQILCEWVEGKGGPVTWETLVETLEDIGLRTLATDIRDVKLSGAGGANISRVARRDHTFADRQDLISDINIGRSVEENVCETRIKKEKEKHISSDNPQEGNKEQSFQVHHVRDGIIEENVEGRSCTLNKEMNDFAEFSQTVPMRDSERRNGVQELSGMQENAKALEETNRNHGPHEEEAMLLVKGITQGGSELHTESTAIASPAACKDTSSPTHTHQWSTGSRRTCSAAASATHTDFLPPVVIIDLSDLDIGSKKLGKGGFGDVYEGNWKKGEGMTVAVRVTRSSSSEPFSQEIEVWNSLPPHRNVTALIGIACGKYVNYIVTEVATNGSLHDHLHVERKALSVDQSLVWASDVAHGMKHLHDHDIIHRNLKSNNVLLTNEWVAKLCDFGTACVLTHTTSTEYAGTYRWMSPEIMRSATAGINKKCDLFSYGMILVELFANVIPYADLEENVDIVLAVRDGKRPPIPPTLPPCLQDLLKSCWEENPQLRPTFDDFINVLTKAE